MNQNAFAALIKAYHDAGGEPGKRLETAILSALGTSEGYGEEIAALCEVEGFTPPESVLSLVRDYSTQAKHKAEALKLAQEMKTGIEKTSGILAEIGTNLDAGAAPDAPAMAKALEDAQGHLAALLKPRKASGLTPENLHDFGTSEGFPIAFLNGLHIPTPGATIIGAKTGGGKTSALVNIARELLDQGRRVCFISYEMNAQEIGLALTLSFMAKGQTAPIQGFDMAQEGPGERFTAPYDNGILDAENGIFQDYFSDLKAHIVKHGTPEFLKAAAGRLVVLLKGKSLAILDGVGDADALAKYIEGTDFDAYLVDYIQAITPGKDAPAEGFRRVGATVDKLRAIVNMGKKTLVLGAQFNREKGEGNGTDTDNRFDPSAEQFREAADIEQLATMALGIGWQKDKEGKKAFFWKVLKHRFSGAIRDARMVSAGQFRYYLNQRGGPWTKPEEWKWQKGSAPKGGSKKTGATEENDWGPLPEHKGKAKK